MIAAIEVVDKRPKGPVKKLRSLFHPYELSARVKKQNKISILQLTYKQYRGAFRIERLVPYLRGCSRNLLCSKELDAELSPFRRFECCDFAEIMMLNFVKDILKKAEPFSRPLKIAYLDPMGNYPETAESLLEHTSELTVVTNVPRFYETVSDKLSEEKGASLIVSNTIDALSDCDILLCSEAVDIHLPLPADAIVFCVEKPCVSLKNTVVYEYCVPVPYKYQRLKPDHLDDFYFLSALYSLCSADELSRLVPISCADGDAVYSAERLSGRLGAVGCTA